MHIINRQPTHSDDPAADVSLAGLRDACPDALIEAVATYLAMPDAGFFASLIAPDGTVIDVNGAALEASGLTRNDVVGKPFWDSGWWNRSGRVQAWLREGFNQALRGEPFRGESTYFWADGTQRIIECACTAIKDGAGGATYVIQTGTDVTDRRRAEQERRASEVLRESEARFRQMADSVPVMLWVTDTEGACTFLSKSWYDFTGQPAGSGLGSGWLNAVHPDDRAAAEEIFRSGARGSKPFQVEYRLRRGDDSYRWTLDIATPWRNAAGEFLGFVGSVIDVTERKRAEDALRASEERLRSAQAAARLGSWDYSFLTRETRWSPEMFDLYGLARDAPVPSRERFASLLHPDDRERTMTVMRMAEIASGPFEVEFRALKPDGGEVWIATKGNIEVGSDGLPAFARGLDQDITTRKEAELVLLEANIKKDNFIATLAHELRNPLAPIRNAVSVLREKGSPDPDLHWCRDVIERQVEQMVRLLDDLLDVSRITSGKLRLRTQRLELAAVVEQAVETARPQIDEGHHQLTIDLPAESVSLDGDETRLAQVFSNLLTNAAKYTNRGGTIHLAGARRAGQVVVSVKDNGIGIGAQHLPHVFEMFSQVERALDRSQGGLGIGLSLVRGLVDMHGGDVMAESEGAGRGSTFTVRLPVRTERPIAHRADLSAIGRPRGAQRRVLVVDDNHDSADSLAMLLSLLGNDVRTAYDGMQGVLMAEEYLPHVILLDVGMPKLNGYAACRRIREQPWSAGMILVACTGWGQDEDRRRTEEAGFDYHFVKPIDPAEIQKVIGSDAPSVHGSAS